MKNRVITISREYGSGGRMIGQRTAEKLNIPCYDYELIGRLTEKSGFNEAYVRDHAEDAAINVFNTFLGRTNGPTKQDQLWILQRNLIVELAEKGPCIIVGRCADYILRDCADCLKVFIHADAEKRTERITRIYGETDIPDLKLRSKDKRRAAYYQFYTDMTWGDIKNYHLALDSGVLGIDKCVDILTQAF